MYYINIITIAIMRSNKHLKRIISNIFTMSERQKSTAEGNAIKSLLTISFFDSVHFIGLSANFD